MLFGHVQEVRGSRAAALGIYWTSILNVVSNLKEKKKLTLNDNYVDHPNQGNGPKHASKWWCWLWTSPKHQISARHWCYSTWCIDLRYNFGKGGGGLVSCVIFFVKKKKFWTGVGVCLAVLCGIQHHRSHFPIVAVLDYVVHLCR